MRLIDADALCDQLIQFQQKLHDTNKELTANQCIAFVENTPTVDAVLVVRCEDCRWGREVCGNIECNVDLNLPPEYHGYGWFCPNGERRDDEQIR